MERKQFILVSVLGVMALSLAGCGESSNRTSSANRRWERVMEKARIEAAQQSIEQGRLEYAKVILEDLIESGSAFSEQAKVTLAELQAATEQFAIAREVDTAANPDLMLN